MPNKPEQTEQEAVAMYDAIGAAIIELLSLKKDRATGRYLTSWGTKSPEGLGRTVARIVHEGLTK